MTQLNPMLVAWAFLVLALIVSIVFRKPEGGHMRAKPYQGKIPPIPRPRVITEDD